MFKEKILNDLQEINELILNMAADGQLLYSLNQFSSTLYGYINTIMTSVMMPIAYSILAIFFMLELYKVSQKVNETGGGSTLGTELIARSLLKVCFCKMLVDSSFYLMGGIYELSLYMTKKINSIVGSPNSLSGLDMSALEQQVDGIKGMGLQLGYFMEIAILKIAIFLAIAFVNIIVIARFFEIYVYTSVSCIPLSTFPHEEHSAIGKSFLKSYCAVCLQGTFIYMIMSFFPIVFQDGILDLATGVDGILDSLYQTLIYSVVLVICTFNCNKWAQKVCNAL